MNFTIIDCYTDEPSGLGVPPYLGTYPRYIAGAIKETNNQYSYLTIDDLRLYIKYKGEIKQTPKTNIKINNTTPNQKKIQQILDNTDILIVISGVHTPGKYLSALPGTIAEVEELIKNIKCFKILTGPAAAAGEGLYGGKIARTQAENFNLISANIEFKLNELIKTNFTEDIQTNTSYKQIKDIAVLGADIVKQHPSYPNLIAEIETAKGCSRTVPCSFCTESIKNTLESRKPEDIINEVKQLHKLGVKHFRLGKQTDFFSHSKQNIELILSEISKLNPETLHIDNINPANVTEEKTKLVVKYCTPGNVAALGVESFDPEVIKANNLNSTPETTYKAIEIINRYGKEPGKNGMPKFLPGINLIFGLNKESKQTHEHNMHWLKKILDNNLLLRRINIRQVVLFPGTQIYDLCKNKYIKKNKKYYWKWRNEVRQKIDYEMLKRLTPEKTILKNLFTEIHDGNTTFCRQLGTYPLIVGVKEKLKLKEFIDIEVTGHMLRSIIGKRIK